MCELRLEVGKTYEMRNCEDQYIKIIQKVCFREAPCGVDESTHESFVGVPVDKYGEPVDRAHLRMYFKSGKYNNSDCDSNFDLVEELREKTRVVVVSYTYRGELILTQYQEDMRPRTFNELSCKSVGDNISSVFGYCSEEPRIIQSLSIVKI